LKPAHRLPLLIGAWAGALALLGALSVGIVALTLDGAERATVAALLAPRAMLVVMVWLAAFALGAWGLVRLHARYVEAPNRLHEQAQVLLAGRDGTQPLEGQGDAANRGLAQTLNALDRERARLRQDVERQVVEASRGIAQERNRLSALMAELTQSVVVCNRDGRILLYNSRARALFRGGSTTPVAAAGAELIGLGRSIHAVFDRHLLEHALEGIEQRMQAGSGDPATQFVTAGPTGRLLRVQMAAVRDPAADAGAGSAAAAPGFGGYVLVLDDITAEVEQEALRDRSLLGLTEGSRASLANLQAALEMLELPDLEPAMRERFQQVVRDEVAAMATRVQALGADVLGGIKTRWPMETMLGADLVAAAARRIEARAALQVGVDDVDRSLWLSVDSYSLLQALGYLAGRLVDEYGLRALQLRLRAAGARAQLDLVWSGPSISTETVMSWQMDEMRSGSEATPLTVRDVVERHGGEFWFERERVRHEAFFRFLLPCASPQAAPAAAAPAPIEGRPEFYDFDLFQASAQASALEDRELTELTYTVFDTETTGLDPSGGDEIIQIGTTRIVNGKLLRHESFEQLVDPRRPLGAESAQVHGIRPEALAGKPTILEVLPVFHAFARDTVLVGHNAAFDMRFLQLKEAASGLRFDQPVLDTLLLSAWVHPNQASHRLEAIAERLGIAVTGRHSALGDALLTAEVFLKLIPLLQAKGVRTLAQARAAALKTYQARLSY
jgi:DNA polymerase-3 subunit epsilon